MNNKVPADQVALLSFIKEYLDKHGYPPTMRDIAGGMHTSSTSVVSYRLKQLEARGLIAITPNVARGIRIV